MRSALRVAVRPSAYIEMVRKTWGDRTLPARPLAGDLWVIGVIDMPTTIRALKTADIDTLRITSAQALTAGADNILADLTKSVRDLQRAAATSRSMLGFTGNAYMSSLLAIEEIWPSVAKAMGGRIIAMAPAGDVLLVARDDDSGAVPALRKAGAEVMHGSLHPLVATVFRWSDKGWVVAAP